MRFEMLTRYAWPGKAALLLADVVTVITSAVRAQKICTMFFGLCLIVAAILLFPQDARSNRGGFSSQTETTAAFSSFLPFVEIVEISLEKKTFVPHEVRAKPGDTIRICNKDPFYHLPFSYSNHNRFGNPKRRSNRTGQMRSVVSCTKSDQNRSVRKAL